VHRFSACVLIFRNSASTSLPPYSEPTLSSEHCGSGTNPGRSRALFILTVVFVLLVLFCPIKLLAQTSLFAMQGGGGDCFHYNSAIIKIDVTTGNIVATYGPLLPQACHGQGVAVVGQYLYHTFRDLTTVYRYDLISGTDGVAFTVTQSSGGLASIAYDGTNLYFQEVPPPGGSSSKIFVYDAKLGTYVKTITLSGSPCSITGGGLCDGLEYVKDPKVLAGQEVLISNNGDAVGPYDVYDISGKFLVSFFINAPTRSGIAWDGTKFYTSYPGFISALPAIDVWDNLGKFSNKLVVTGTIVPDLEDLAIAPCSPPPNTTMVAWYPFDDLGKNLASGNTAILVNNPNAVEGTVALALSFDGVSQYVESPDSIAINFGPASCASSGSYSACPADFSIDTWIQIAGNPTAPEVILDKRGGTPLRGYELAYLSTPSTSIGQLGLELADGSGVTDYISPNVSLEGGDWHHIAVVVQRAPTTGTITWYVDGQCLGSPTCTTSNPSASPGSLVTTTPLRIGAAFASTGWTGFLDGALDELEIYNRVLTPQEVHDLYIFGLTGGGKCKPAI